MPYKEFKELNLPEMDREMLSYWENKDIFQLSLDSRKSNPSYVFYEGPPSANGLPGIHHVMSRTIKDLFCRYKTLKGFLVNRKGGWDTHGLPVELGVEKKLGITKVDIGKSVSVEEYNRICRTEVMKYKDKWDDLTLKMGFWMDLDHPYITFDRNYIESLWSLLKKLHDKGLLYKGYTIQPFSPAAGTGLSSHELNLPGTYRNVKDTSVVAQFKLLDRDNEYLLAWTTTPWTLPSNTALAVGPKIEYAKIQTFNPYTKKPITVYLAKNRYPGYFTEKAGFVPNEEDSAFQNVPVDKQLIPYRILGYYSGKDLEGLRFEQLLPFAQPETGDAFRILTANFVTTEDGTGIVHIAPSFGSDDMKTANENGIGTLTLVDKQGRFTEDADEFAGRYVKNFTDDPDYVSVDVDIAVKLKLANRAFKIEKYEHSYPHCWRTDKPIIYYPLNSWFIKTTAAKDRMVELNKTINWQPGFTGTGRFGNWLENLVDWNLSRSRYWGTPLPIWSEIDTEDSEIKCIGDFEQLKSEVAKSVEAGFMDKPLSDDFDPHKPYVDEIVLVSANGKKMYRETDLIDVWFDSGAMPYAQWHYPFENEEVFKQNFPADFIAEGVDQTRGWFFTLHAISVLLFDSVAFKNVVSNGLVLDSNGNKMSKRLGNAADPFEIISKHGADATRWYLMSNSQPWDNLKFDEKGISEVKRKFFGTLYNTYSFFTLYANIDGFQYTEEDIPNGKRPEIDRWVISLLNSLIKEVDGYYERYEPTKAARAIQSFVSDHLSNWYVRLCRRRFWKGAYSEDKISAYQTLYQCLEKVFQLMSPIAPFFSDTLYLALNSTTNKNTVESIHISDFPIVEVEAVDLSLEERMQLAQDISSLVLSLRKKINIKVRQPLHKILIPVLNDRMKSQIMQVADLILSEVNVKGIKYVDDTSGIIIKKIKPDFKVLGPKLGKKMGLLAGMMKNYSQEDIKRLETNGFDEFDLAGEIIKLEKNSFEISSEDIPGWLVTNMGDLTVALDVHVTPELQNEGNAREFVNKIQRLRKDSEFNVTDRIRVDLEENEKITDAIKVFKDYICTEILAEELVIRDRLDESVTIDINEIPVKVNIETI